MKLWEIGKLLHGGDYNVDQWLDRPDILAEDIRLMKLAGVNVVSLCIFSWSSLEPEEGVYTFEWLDEVMDSMYKNGIYVILATPSAGKPPWLIKKYPDIMRTREHRQRLLYGERENHCNSNKIFREKVCRIDEKLAERYANHPALILWHISARRKILCKRYSTKPRISRYQCAYLGLIPLGRFFPGRLGRYARRYGVNAVTASREPYSKGISPPCGQRT